MSAIIRPSEAGCTRIDLSRGLRLGKLIFKLPEVADLLKHAVVVTLTAAQEMMWHRKDSIVRFTCCFREPATVTFNPPYTAFLPSEPQSLHQYAWEEANRHRWYEGERLGCDPGDAALKDWFRKHWLPFCRHRRLEHVEGRQLWDAFAREEFGQVCRLLEEGDLLLDRILDRMEHGYDNFEIINWALDWHLDMERVIELLLLIDINRARLEPIAFESAPSPAATSE